MPAPVGTPDAWIRFLGKELQLSYSERDIFLIRSLIAEFNALPRRAQEAAIEMIRILRKVEDDERERDNRPPHIIGGAE